MKGECCEHCFALMSGGCLSHACPCHSTHTEIDRILIEFGGRFGAPNNVPSHVLKWLRDNLVQFQSSIEQSVVEAAKDHYWDSLTEHKDLIIEHLSGIIKAFKKE